MQSKNMENNIYYDTNIFIDLFDLTRPYSKYTLDLTEKFINNGANLYINSDTMTNAYYVLSRTKQYSNKELLTILKKALSLFIIVAVENQDSIKALELCEDEKFAFSDYEDALQYVCAKKVKADLIVTNDKGFTSLDIEIKRTNN